MMKRLFLVLASVYLFSVLGAHQTLAGSPWSEMVPRGLFWTKYYYVQTSSPQKFDNTGEKHDLAEAIKEYAHSIDMVYGVTDNFFVGAVIPYYAGRCYLEQSKSGIGDIEVGGQYRYYKTDKWSSALRVGIRFPTGHVDDPDDARDISLGTGYTRIRISNLADYITPDKDWIFSSKLRFHLQLEDDYDSGATAKATYAGLGDTYDKDPGEELWAALGVERRNLFPDDVRLSLTLEGRFHAKDNYSSDSDAFNHNKELNTSTILYFIQPEVKYNLWTKHKIPMRIYLNYRIPLDGRNTYETSRLEAGVEVFF
ncbi:hypothetical protein KAX00_00150 [bacterium]|nr:hypothetical protein [bacterium]